MGLCDVLPVRFLPGLPCRGGSVRLVRKHGASGAEDRTTQRVDGRRFSFLRRKFEFLHGSPDRLAGGGNRLLNGTPRAGNRFTDSFGDGLYCACNG